jgi:hypothetical protein
MGTGFDISKYITATDIASAVTAGVIAYVMNRTKADDQQQRPTDNAGVSDTTPDISDQPLSNAITPDQDPTQYAVRNGDSAFEDAKDWWEFTASHGSCDGDAFLNPSEWSITSIAEDNGVSPEAVQQLVDSNRMTAFLQRFISLGQNSTVTSVGYSQTGNEVMHMLNSAQGSAQDKVWQTILSGGTNDDAIRAYCGEMMSVCSKGSITYNTCGRVLAAMGGG